MCAVVMCVCMCTRRRVCAHVQACVCVHPQACVQCNRVCACVPAGVCAYVCVTSFSLSVCALCWLTQMLHQQSLLADSDWAHTTPSPPPPSDLASPKLVSLSLEKRRGGAQGRCGAPGVRDTGFSRPSDSLLHCQQHGLHLRGPRQLRRPRPSHMPFSQQKGGKGTKRVCPPSGSAAGRLHTYLPSTLPCGHP